MNTNFNLRNEIVKGIQSETYEPTEQHIEFVTKYNDITEIIRSRSSGEPTKVSVYTYCGSGRVPKDFCSCDMKLVSMHEEKTTVRPPSFSEEIYKDSENLLEDYYVNSNDIVTDGILVIRQQIIEDSLGDSLFSNERLSNNKPFPIYVGPGGTNPFGTVNNGSDPFGQVCPPQNELRSNGDEVKVCVEIITNEDGSKKRVITHTWICPGKVTEQDINNPMVVSLANNSDIITLTDISSSSSPPTDSNTSIVADKINDSAS